MEYESKKRFLINAAFISLIAAICYIAIKFMTSFLLPFIIALLISFLSNKASGFLEKKFTKKKDWLKFIVLVFFYVFLIAATVFFLFLIFKYSGAFFVTLKNYLSAPDNTFIIFTKKLSEKAERMPEGLRETILNLLDGFSKRALSFVADIAANATVGFAKFLPRFFISAAVTVVSSFYITKDYKRLIKFLKLMIGEKRFLFIKKIKGILTGSVLRLFSGYLILSGITFLTVLIAFLIFSVKHAVIYALAVGIIDLLPVLGAGTVLVPAAVFWLINGKITSFILLIFLYVFVWILRNFLEPKLLGKRLNINPLLMLLTLFVGLRIGSLAGMILLPVTVVVIITYYKEQIENEL